MQRKIWINGDYINWEDAQVHILSHSHQRGSLIFGFIPIFENDGMISLFRLNDHVERLFTSCETAGIPLEYSPQDIQVAIKDTVRKNPGSKLKTAVTGKVKPGSKAAKRRKSFCARSKGWTGERGKAARRRWKC